ncbi:ester cyclase [Sphingobium amiense]|uniref:Ester cyclase n=1 Tax=Sphingobium amiense TaxID=135719 RepID=A0A494W3P3_9SPHN|nr:ester cyclase [Sphingobium amiense]BBD99174.1 ester cyclase [Sphingobium amiense]
MAGVIAQAGFGSFVLAVTDAKPLQVHREHWQQEDPTMNESSQQTATASMYARYIACLNRRAWSELGEFVAADVVHNGRMLGVDGYRAMLEGNFRDIPDLYFNADLVVADESHVASRLRFDCTPIGQFMGVPVNGRRVVFYEHAFYTLRAGKIAEVLSVIDKAAVEALMRP